VVVGVNRFQIDEEEGEADLLTVDPRVQDEQLERLAEQKKSRESSVVEENLATLKTAARGDANLMLPILDCVKAYCTLGEICDVLRDVFGEYREQVTL
jgi:methylmalonyl-CoA mutase N-terminal domain/subunit